MTDTHCHLYDGAFGEEVYDVVNRAIASGVTRLVFPNIDSASIEPMRELHAVYPFNTSMAMGLHPTELGEHPDETLDAMERMFDSGEYCAVGEVGIDLHFEDNPPLEAQQRAFERQLGWARERRMPVIIHSRDSRDEVLDSVRRVFGNKQQAEVSGVTLVFHSFTGGPDDVRAIREVCDPYFGINGVVTFKNAPELREAVREIGAGKLLLETDSPWLAPVPHRGRRNESGYLPLILEASAQALGMEAKELERITDANAAAVFGGI